MEIECGHPEKTYVDVKEALGRDGFPVNFAPSSKHHGVGRDGSGIEVSSRILRGGAGYAELTELMDWLHEYGCYVTRSDGMHVHVGAKEYVDDEKATRVLARIWYNNQALISRMCSSHRAHSHVCAPITAKTADEVGKPNTAFRPWYVGQEIPKFWGGTRYSGINFGSVEGRGTIEFRLHEGCLDPTKAIAWVKFCQALVDYSHKQRKVITCASKTELLNALSVPEDAASKLWRRQRTLPQGRKYRRPAVKS